MTSHPVARRSSRFRIPLPKTVTGRRRLTAVIVILASAAAGYLTTCIAYPRPIFGGARAVSRVIGMPISEAERLLTDQGFKVKVADEAPDPEIPAGAVVWQDPPADVIAPQGASVELVRSSGPPTVPVPDLAEFDRETALRVLTAAGLKVGEIDTVPGGAESDVVVGTRPAAGNPLVPGSSVDVVVSQGPAGVAVPNVIGLRLEDARRQLEEGGFRVGRITRVEGRRGPPGTVIEQQPAAGARATRQARIDLVVTEVN